MAGPELVNVGRTDMREDIKFKIAENTQLMVFTSLLVTGMPFTSNGFGSICTGTFGLSFFLFDSQANILFQLRHVWPLPE